MIGTLASAKGLRNELDRILMHQHSSDTINIELHKLQSTQLTEANMRIDILIVPETSQVPEEHCANSSRT